MPAALRAAAPVTVLNPPLTVPDAERDADAAGVDEPNTMRTPDADRLADATPEEAPNRVRTPAAAAVAEAAATTAPCAVWKPATVMVAAAERAAAPVTVANVPGVTTDSAEPPFSYREVVAVFDPDVFPVMSSSTCTYSLSPVENAVCAPDPEAVTVEAAEVNPCEAAAMFTISV